MGVTSAEVAIRPAEQRRLLAAMQKLRGESARSRQRLAALWVAVLPDRRREKWVPATAAGATREILDVPKELLREVCRALRVYDAATFCYYMADLRQTIRGKARAKGGNRWFAELKDGGQLVGWHLTDEGRRAAAFHFGWRRG